MITKNIPNIIIAGPTASGKTKLSIELAKKIRGEIINADIMQMYKGFEILKAGGRASSWYTNLKTALRRLQRLATYAPAELRQPREGARGACEALEAPGGLVSRSTPGGRDADARAGRGGRAAAGGAGEG